MKTLIAFFYLLNGDVVSLTVSDFEAFKAGEEIPADLTCDALISNEGFADGVRGGLKDGESMRAACFRSASVEAFGEPYISVTITPSN